MLKKKLYASLGLIILTIFMLSTSISTTYSELISNSTPFAGVCLQNIENSTYARAIVKSANQAQVVAVPMVEIWTEYETPTDDSFKSYMDADFITDTTSTQYQMKSDYQMSDNGIYTVDDRYCVAVGSYYTTEIGTKLDIVMENGAVIPCILADCKDDKHTDDLNRQNPNGSVIEFVVDSHSLDSIVSVMGDCSYVSEEFIGDIDVIRVYEGD